MFPISCASFGLCLDFNANLISFFIICTRLSLFGSTYITLMAQNSKTIRIIFLPKCTQKYCTFYAVFYTFFLRISVLSGKTKSAKEALFYGNFHIIWILWVSPCLILRKFTQRGPSVFSGSACRDSDTPTVCRQNRYAGLLSSFHVFLSWQGLHRLCQFFSSQNRTGSPRCGLIWSTTVAVTAWPSFKHWTHKGCAFKYLALAFCHCLL